MKTIVNVVQNLLKPYVNNKDTAAKQAVESNIAPVEADATSASGSYSEGEQLVLNDILYDVTASISIGDALTVGTNIAPANDLSTQIGGKQDQIEVTSMPTASASNVGQVLIYIGATTSTYTSGQSYQSTFEGGSYIWKPTAVDKVDWESNGILSAKNLLEPIASTKTVNSITYTVADDYSISTSGTSSANGGLMIGQIDVKSGLSYKLTGCPSDGGDSTYEFVLRTENNISGPLYKSIVETGNGVTFTADEDVRVYCQIRYASGVSADETFYPMIRLATDTDNTYQPYAKTNQQLTAQTTGLQDSLNENGCKNVLPLSLSYIKKINVNGTWSDNVYSYNNANFTIDADGDTVKKITVSTTAATSAAANLILVDNTVSKAIKTGKYALSKGNTTSGTVIFYNAYNNSTLVRQIAVVNGENAYAECNIDYSDYNTQMIALGITSGATVSNAEFYPMICLLSEYLADPTFATYSKTNKELTSEISDLTITLNNNLIVTSPGNSAYVFDIACNATYKTAIIFSGFSVGYLAFWSGAYHYVNITTNNQVTIAQSNNTANGLRLTFAGSEVKVSILSLDGSASSWSITPST